VGREGNSLKKMRKERAQWKAAGEEAKEWGEEQRKC